MIKELLSPEQAIKDLTNQINNKKNHDAKLALIKVGDSIEVKKKAANISTCCKSFDLNVWTIELPELLPEDVLAKSVYTVSQDPSINGVMIICQEKYNSYLLGAAAGQKDVEGRLYTDSGKFLPSLISSTLYLLASNNVSCINKNILVVYDDHENLLCSAFKDTVFARNTALTEHNIDYDGTFAIVPENTDIVLSLTKKDVELDFTNSSPEQLIIDAGIKYSGSTITGGIKIENLKGFNGKLCAIPGGIDAIIPYIIVLNTLSAKNDKIVDKS